MADTDNELGIKVGIELDVSNLNSLDGQLKPVNEHFKNKPAKIAFTLDKANTIKNINAELKKLVKSDIDIPDIKLNITIDKNSIASQLQQAINGSVSNISLSGKGTTTIAPPNETLARIREFYARVKEIANLEDKITLIKPNEVNKLAEYNKQLSVAEARMTELMTQLQGHIEIQQYSQLDLLIEKLSNRSAILAANLEDVKTAAAATKADANLLAQANIDVIGKQAETRVEKLTGEYKDLNLDMSKVISTQAVLRQHIADNSIEASEKISIVREDYKKLGAEISAVTAEAQILQNRQANVKGFDNLSAQLDRWIEANKRLSDDPHLWQRVMSLRDAVRGYTGTLEENQATMASVQAEAERLGLTTESVGQRLSKLWRDHFQTAVVMLGLHAVRNGMNEIYQNVLTLDRSMTQLKIVTNANAAAMRAYKNEAVAAAREAKASVADILDSSTTYARLGLNDVVDLAKYTAMYANVSGSSVGDATTAVTAIIKGYNKDENEIKQILSELVKVGNNYAISASELGEGLANAGSALQATGNNLEESIGLLTAANASVQNISKSSTMLRTISTRLTGTKADLEEAAEEGLDVQDAIENQSKYRSEILAETNGMVDILMEDGKTYRNTFSILQDLSKIWNKLDASAQAVIVNDIAGTRGTNVFNSIMQNFDDAVNAARDASGAMNELEAKNAEYANSIEGHMADLKAAFADFSTDILDSDVIKWFVDAGTAVIDTTDKLVELGGVLPVLAGTLASVASISTFQKSMIAVRNTLNGTADSAIQATEQLEKFPSFMQKYIALGGTKAEVKDIKSFTLSLSTLSKQSRDTAMGLTTLSKTEIEAISKALEAVDKGKLLNGQLIEQQINIADLTEEQKRNLTTVMGLKTANGQYNFINEKATENVLKNSAAFKALSKTEQNAVSAAINATSAAQANNATVKQSVILQKSWNAALGIGKELLLGLAASAITWGVSKLATEFTKLLFATEEEKNELQQIANTSKDAADKATDVSTAVNDIVREYKKLGDNAKWSTEQFETAKSLQEEIASIVGATADNVDLINGKYREQLEILRNISGVQLDNAIASAKENLTSQTGNLLGQYGWADRVGVLGSIKGNFDGNASDIGGMASFLSNNGVGAYNAMGANSHFTLGVYDLTDADSILSYYDDLNVAIGKLVGEYDSATLAQNKFYGSLVSERDSITGAVTDYRAAIQQVNELEAIKTVQKDLQNVTIETKEDFDAWRDTLVDSSDGLSDFERAILKVADEAFPEYSMEAEQVVSANARIVGSIGTLGEKFEDIQDKIDSLDQAQQQLTDNGFITAKTFKDLQDNNLLGYLVATADGITVNKDALLNEAEAARINAIQKLQDAYAADVLAIAEGDLYAEGSPAKEILEAEAIAADKAGKASAAAAPGVFSLASAMLVLRDTDKDSDIGKIEGKLNELNRVYNGLLSTINAVTIDTQKYTSTSKALTNSLNDQKNALNAQKDALQATKKEMESSRDKLKAYGKAVVDELDKQIDKLNEQKELQDQTYEAQIDALKEKKEALQEANDEEDRALKLAELQDALARARTQRTKRVYTESEGYVWRADESAISTAQGNLDDQIRAWNREDAINAVDREIEAIEKLKDAYNEQIQAQIDSIKELKDTYNETINILGMSWEEYQITLEAQAEFQGKTLEQMAEYHVSYKESVLASMQELADVENQLIEVENRLAETQNNLAGATSGSAKDSAGATNKAAKESLADAYKNLALQIAAAGEESNKLKERERELEDVSNNLREGTVAHFRALEELANAKQKSADKDIVLAELTAEYIKRLANETELTEAERKIQMDTLNNLLENYDVNYGIIAEILQDYLNNLDVTVVTNDEQFALIGEIIKGFYEKAKDSFDKTGNSMETFTSVITSNVQTQIGALDSLKSKLDEIAAAAKAASEAVARASLTSVSTPAHAAGTRYISRSGYGQVDEAGAEITVKHSQNGRYTMLEVGDGVVPHNLTNTLFNAAINPTRMVENTLKRMLFSNNVPMPAFAKSPTTGGTMNVSVGDIVMNGVQDCDGFARALRQNVGNIIRQEFSRR